MKREVYLNEFNVLMEKTVYLPLVSGLLQSYARKIDVIEENYQFMPFLFIRDHPEKVISSYKNPAVAAFSVSMWNMNFSLAIAEEVKKRFPECLIVFGGPNVPFETENFFHSHPFIDVTVKGEGEQAFADLLLRLLESRDFGDIPGISYLDHKSNRCVVNQEKRALLKDLDSYPSPYLEGAYEYLLSEDINFQAIIETNRGCPYICAYCFWGKGGLSKKFTYFSLDRIKQIAEWCGKNRIKYIFCADSNFGIFQRDLEIANYFVQAKLRYGFPEKFRVCYAKNSKDTVYEIGKLLNKYDMDKGMTLSRQTNNIEALENIGRKNFKMSVFNDQQKRYNNDNIPVYTELILGLPGETYESFIYGIEDILKLGFRNQIFIYLCQVLPNTELANEEYQKKFNISTNRVLLTETHGASRSQDGIPEYEDIIVSTVSMPMEDWKKMVVVSWVFQLFHGLKLGFYVLLYLADRYNLNYTGFIEYIALRKTKTDKATILRNEVEKFYKAIDSMLKGNSRMRLLPDLGDIYWEQEEASYLSILPDKNAFYNELYLVLKEYLESNGVSYADDELKEVVTYQNAIIPDFNPIERKEIYFTYNIPEYFDAYFSGDRKCLMMKPQVLVLNDSKNYRGDKRAFAREVILYGRKNNRMIRNVQWYDTYINQIKKGG